VQPDQDSLEITNWVLYKSLDPERLKSLKNPEVFLSWVYAIAKNDLIAHLRQCTKNLPINLEEQDSSLPSGRIRNSSEIVEASEGIQQILIRAKSVDSRLPHILDLELQGFSDQEIGERLRITPQNVRTIRSRGLLKIKSMLNEPKQ
jgi:RNA polymerase sigma factor (sigma-70 family)